jgi:DNA gyrase subunit A
VDSDDLMIINKSGITIRLRVADLRIIGRATQGVRLIKINEGDEISSVAKIENEDKTEIILNQSELPADESLNPDLIDPDLINEN